MYLLLVIVCNFDFDVVDFVLFIFVEGFVVVVFVFDVAGATAGFGRAFVFCFVDCLFVSAYDVCVAYAGGDLVFYWCNLLVV